MDQGPAPASRSDGTSVIVLQHVWAAYEQTDVLQDISLAVAAGDFVGLIGPNGGGKTTLLKLLVGLLAPVRGTVTVLGKPVAQSLRDVAYVPQEIRFDRDFPVTAWEVARMGRLGRRGLLRPYTTEDGAIVDEALERVGVPHLRDRPVGTLSGGERQRVYIARALASQPRVLLLDEPLANVDPNARDTIQALMATLASELTIVMSSHDVGALMPYLDRIGYLNRELVYFGAPEGAPVALRQSFRCPAELASDELTCPDPLHDHSRGLP